VLKIDMPLPTLQRILAFLTGRKILVENIQMNATSSGEAILILHCQVEKDRIRHTQNLLEKMEGIEKVELLESKMTHTSRQNADHY